jgi:hypothetical protein
LVQEFNQAQQDFFKEYSKAKTDEERTKLIKAKNPQPGKYAVKIMRLVEEHPKDSFVIDGLIWVLTRAGSGSSSKKALDLLVKDHIESPKLEQVAGTLVYSDSKKAESLLRTMLEKSPHKEVQAAACLTLGRRIKNQSERQSLAKAEREKMSAAAEALFERVIKEFSEVKSVKSSLGESAKRELFELRNLAIGKTAPDIAGEDIEGKKFRLADYRGKVVVLDFWGNW